MIKYKKTYLEFFGYGEQDLILCECGCRKRAVDVHHIDIDRGHNDIENLVGLARVCHEKAQHNPEFNELIKWQHLRKVKRRRKILGADAQ